MPVSFRSSGSAGALLIAIGTCALLVLIVVLMTGGFVIEIGPLRLTALRWHRPLTFAVTAWTAAALLCRRQGLAAITASMAARLDRHAVAIAIVMEAFGRGTIRSLSMCQAQSSGVGAREPGRSRIRISATTAGPLTGCSRPPCCAVIE
jgi:hypothetical protein